jgi:Flp pilus assembly protein TadG
VAVEFALIVPVLLLLLFGTVTAGAVFVDHLKLQAAAREGARAGALVPARACSSAMDRLTVDGATCRVVSGCPGGSSTIRLQATQPVTLPVLGDRTVTLTASAAFSCLI